MNITVKFLSIDKTKDFNPESLERVTACECGSQCWTLIDSDSTRLTLHEVESVIVDVYPFGYLVVILSMKIITDTLSSK